MLHTLLLHADDAAPVIVATGIHDLKFARYMASTLSAWLR